MAQQPRDYLKPALWLMGAILVMGAGIGTHNQWERVEAEVIALIPDTVDGYELQRSNLIHERRKDFLSGVGTAATIVGGVGLFLNLRLAERRLTLDTQKIQQDAKQTETRLTAERFSRATEQLGHESIHVRLGGIYSLEQIAKDSPDDHWTVMEVLSAFIREESKPQKTSEEQEAKAPKIRTDIQAALTVICRRDNRAEPSGIDLRGTNLIEADLRGASLTRANLHEADLRGASFAGVNLCEANLRGVDLRGANLVGVNLSDANLEGAALHEANLSKAILKKAFLSRVKLMGVNLCEANLEGAVLDTANLTGANLTKANLAKVNLFRALLFNANLSKTNLNGASLIRVNCFYADLTDVEPLQIQTLDTADLNKSVLSKANLDSEDFFSPDLKEAILSGRKSLLEPLLSRTNLRDANLCEATCYGANFSGANLSGANLSGADFNSTNISRAILKGASLGNTNFKGAETEGTVFPEGYVLVTEAT